MPFWIPLLIAIALSVVGQLLTPKVAGPKADDKPQVPEIDETRPIPVLWGEWLITNPQLFWWGDYKASANKKKIFTGLWFKKITTGFKYELGMALGLCDAGSGHHVFSNYRGIDFISEIQINEKVLWSGSAGQGDVISIDNPGFFGGSEEGGNGGVKAQIEVHTGDYTPSLFQTVSTYLLTQLDITPTWRGLAYLVWRGPSAGKDIGWYGNSPSIQPIAVKAVRRPNLSIFLPLVGTETYHEVDGPGGEKDANPVHCLAELFINPDWGMGDVDVDDFDHVSWRAAAQTLQDEGNGFSYYWDQQTSIEDMADIILRQIDGIVWTDYATGLIHIKLARQDFDVDDLPVLDNSDFIEITSLTRGSYDDTINEVRINYTKHADNFKTRTAFDQDLANVTIQEGEGINVDINYPGVSNETLARQLARRDLQVLTQPLLRFTGTTDRIAHTLAPGALFVFSWPEEGIEAVTMRVTTVKAGTLENGSIALECVEDKFAAADALFTTNTTAWTDPVGDAEAVVNGNTQELPYWFAKDTLNRIFSFAERPDSSQQAYQLLADSLIEETSVDFTPSGVLDADMPFSTSAPVTYQVNDVTDVKSISLPASAQDVTDGLTLVMIDNEIMAFGHDAGISSAFGGWMGTTGVSGVNFNMEVWFRGLLGTTPQKHLAGARVWFIGTHIGRSETSYGSAHSVQSRFLTQTLRGLLDSADSDLYTTTIGNRSARPYAPGWVRFNTNVYYGTPGSIIPDTGNIDVTWKRRNRTTEVSPLTDYYLNSTDIAPEYDETYTLKIYGDSNVLLRTVTGLTGLTYTYTNAFETADAGSLQGSLTFVLYAVSRNGLTSHQAVRIAVTRTGGSVPGSLPTFTPSGSYVAPIVNVAGIPVTTAPTNGQALAYNSTLNAWVPTAGIGTVWYSGSGVPSSGTGNDGDYYFRTSTGDVYKKVTGSWGSPIANLTGPTGATGAAGSAGATGATGSTGATGAFGGAVTIEYTFSTTTTDADPGSGLLRLDQATQNTATMIYADLNDDNAVDWTAVLDTMDDSSSTVKGIIRLVKKTDLTKWLLLHITAVTTASGYRKLSVSVIGSSGSSPFSNSDTILLCFTRNGDSGPTFSGVRCDTGYRNVSTTSGSVKTVTFSTEDFDTDAYHSTSSNTSRFVAPFTGYYRYSFWAAWQRNTTGVRYITAFFNNATVLEYSSTGATSAGVSGDDIPAGVATGIYHFTAGQYIEVTLYQDSGSTLSASVIGSMQFLGT